MLRRSICVLKNTHFLYISSRLKLHTSISPIFYARFDKDLPNPQLPTPVSKLYGHDTDILHEQLKSCKSLDRTLELIDKHLNVMNTKHIVICFENIHSFVKNDPILGQSLTENPIFTSLCSRVMKAIRLFEPEEVIECYKVLCVLQVRSNTYIMQCVLKMLGAHLNNMTLNQLTFLSFLLHRQRHNPLVDGLRLALPLVLQVQIDQQLDSDNLTDVVNCLQLACRSRLKPTVIQKIVNVVTEKAADLATDDALTVAFALLSVETPVDGYKELLDTALGIVSRNISELSDQKILTLVKTCRSNRVYHFALFSNIANYIVSKKWNLELTYLMLCQFHSVEFAPSNLIDHFADVLCSESNCYKAAENLYYPLNCIEILTCTAYRPSNIDAAARITYSDETKLENFKSKLPHLYVKFFSCLAMLGHFPRDCLSHILHEDFLFNAWHISKKLGKATQFENTLLSLFWSLKLYDEAANFAIPSAVIDKIINDVYRKHEYEYPLAKFIENGLGGSQFLQTGVLTDDGHVIDHIVAMRSGNYPVSLQSMKLKERKVIPLQNKVFVEDLILPDDAKVIAIIVAKEDCYFRDPEVLKGWIDVKVRSLEKKNYSVAVINFAVWKNLPDREKIPYLMREIKNVISDNVTLWSKLQR